MKIESKINSEKCIIESTSDELKKDTKKSTNALAELNTDIERAADQLHDSFLDHMHKYGNLWVIFWMLTMLISGASGLSRLINNDDGVGFIIGFIIMLISGCMVFVSGIGKGTY